MGFTINSEIKTKLTYKDVVLIASAMSLLEENLKKDSE